MSTPPLAGTPDLFRVILKRVSRSFFLTLQILPSSLRRPIGLAYLFARAADTIADTTLITPSERLRYLDLFCREFSEGAPSRVEEITAALTGRGRIPEERELLARLPECFTLYRTLPDGDRGLVGGLLLTLTRGMEMDLTLFPGENEGKLNALETREDLDRYTYYVAGCVGEFWTRIHIAHRSSLAAWDPKTMMPRGVQFGKGLQMTNILRDIPRDLRIGRCYLPRHDLARLDLTPEDLLDPESLSRVCPLLDDLLALTLRHYKAGWAYTTAIPRREVRMRLACAWPLLIGLKTLSRVATAENLLDPDAVIKIPRRTVYGLLAASLPAVLSNRALNAYARQLRRPLIALPAGVTGVRE